MKLLLDVHFSPVIGEQLRPRGHDVVAAAEVLELRQTDDERLLARAAEDGRALVTNDAKDFLPLVTEWMRSGRCHAGVLLTSDHSMPRTRTSIGRLVVTLDTLMSEHAADDALGNQVMWLAPPR